MWQLQQFRILILFITSFNYVVFSLYEGDECYHKKKDKPGKCKIIEDCEGAVSELKEKIFPENCGFIKDTAIVCCVPIETSKPKTTTTTSTTTTTTTTTVTTVVTTRLPGRRTIGEMSQKKCKEYEALAYKKEFSPILLDEDDEEKVEICPWEIAPIIYHGTKTNPGEFPHMALLKYKTPITCGGSLISENFVLTAAHCITEDDKPVLVRLGDVNISDPNDDQYVQEINIKKIHVHPGYVEPIQYNDLALLELERPANLSVYLKPICLHTKDDINFQKQALVTGWGLTENHTFSEHLLLASLDLFSEESCAAKFNRFPTVFPKGVNYSISICAGSFTSEKDTCGGDSGGPLQLYALDVFCSHYIIGVTSFGLRCGDINSPAVYTRVYPYVEWIENIVWPI